MQFERFFASLKLIATSLLLFTLLRVLFFIIYYNEFEVLTFFETITAFGNGIRFDLVILLTFMAIPLLMINLPFKLPKLWTNLWLHIMLLTLLLASLFIIGDIIYYENVKRHIANELLLLTDDISYIGEMMLQYWYAVLAVIPIYIILVRFARKKILLRETVKRHYSRLAYVPAFILVIIFTIVGMRGHLGGGKAISIIDAYSVGKTAYGNLSLNGLFSAVHFSQSSGSFNSPRFFDKKELFANLGLKERINEKYPLMHTLPHVEESKKNIVIILLESWSAKYMGALGATHGVTPHFDALCKKGTLYTNFYANGQRSIQGIQAILTSIPPFSSLPDIGFGLEIYGHSRIAKMATELGYETLFIQSSNRRSFRMDAIANTLGFKHYYGKEDMPMLLDYEDDVPRFGWDYETLMFYKKKIDQLKKPFLSFVFTGTTHVPYPKLPKEHLRYKHDPLNENGFLNTLKYADWALGEFFSKAEKMPWYKNTIFVVTADHALGAYQHGNFKELFHTPLLIIDGSDPKGKRIDRYASQIDIMPTITQYIGYDKPFTAFGRSLLEPNNRDFALVSEHMAVGLISKEGYLRHTLHKVLESSYTKIDLPQKEQKLFSYFQVVNDLLQANQWAP